MKLLDKKTLLSTVPFSIEELDLEINAKPLEHKYHRLICQDWVNVLPVTIDQQAILIKQPRAGALKYTLEVPGGVIDLHEKDPTMAVVRELEEETGFTSQRILSLGSMYANPAIMNNRCHFFLALGCYLNPQRQHFPDAEENIEVQAVPVGDLSNLVRQGAIDHCLAALCIMLASKYVDIGEAPAYRRG